MALVNDYQSPANPEMDEKVKLRSRYLVKKPQEFLSEISSLNPLELREVQEYLWDVIMEESEKRSLKITRSDIISRFEPTTNYQYRAGCTEPLGYCTLNMCIKLDNRCATNRLRGMIEVLRKIMTDIYGKEDLDKKLQELDGKNQLLKSTFDYSFKADEGTGSSASKTSTGVKIKQKIKNLRELLFSVVEIDGAETVTLIDGMGNIIEMVTNSKLNSRKINELFSYQIQFIEKFGFKVNWNHPEVLIHEYDQGLVIIRPVMTDIYLIIVTRTQSTPAKFIQKAHRVASEMHKNFTEKLK